MDRKSDYHLSATEINQYLYCPYQWYYQRIYKDQMEGSLVKGKTKKNFRKGIDFHKKYYIKAKLVGFLKSFVLFSILAIILIIIYVVVRNAG